MKLQVKGVRAQMAQFESKDQSFLKRHKTKMQTIALLAVLILPFLLYVFTKGGQTTIVNVLLGFLTLIMLGIIAIS